MADVSPLKLAASGKLRTVDPDADSIKINGIQLTAGAALGSVLTSDAGGAGAWAARVHNPTTLSGVAGVEDTASNTYQEVGVFILDPSDYLNQFFVFEAVIQTTTPAKAASIELFNLTDGVVVTRSTLTSVSTVPERKSVELQAVTDIPTSEKVYSVRLKMATAGGPAERATCKWAVLKVVASSVLPPLIGGLTILDGWTEETLTDDDGQNLTVWSGMFGNHSITAGANAPDVDTLWTGAKKQVQWTGANSDIASFDITSTAKSYTFALTIDLQQTSNWNTILASPQTGYVLWLGINFSEVPYCFYSGGSTANSGGTMALGEQRLVFVLDAGNTLWSLYIDGVLHGTGAYVGTDIASQLSLGGNLSAAEYTTMGIRAIALYTGAADTDGVASLDAWLALHE